MRLARVLEQAEMLVLACFTECAQVLNGLPSSETLSYVATLIIAGHQPSISDNGCGIMYR